MPTLPNASALSPRARVLVDWFKGHRAVAVAFSGGVDSSVVLAAAVLSDANVIAITAKSPSVASWQIEIASRVADDLAVTHEFVETDEVEQPAYAANDSNRCFHCKSTLYRSVQAICDSFPSGKMTLVSGTNSDDLGDYRPGIKAGELASVRTPLADLGLTKLDVRSLASEFGLRNADLPASPCLASRIAYGVAVTPERLSRIEQAEGHLRAKGFHVLRVRLHEGEMARIEVPRDDLNRLIEADQQHQISSHFQRLGFRYVTIDLQGFSSGSLNRLVNIASPAVPTDPNQT